MPQIFRGVEEEMAHGKSAVGRAFWMKTSWKFED
jgi:hypothetical protein